MIRVPVEATSRGDLDQSNNRCLEPANNGHQLRPDNNRRQLVVNRHEGAAPAESFNLQP